MSRGKLTDEQRRTGSHLSPGFRSRVRRHEEHHQRCARAFGADITWHYEDPRTGAAAEFTIVRSGHLTPVQFAAIFYAGGSGCCASYDEKVARRWIDRYPRGSAGLARPRRVPWPGGTADQAQLRTPLA